MLNATIRKHTKITYIPPLLQTTGGNAVDIIYDAHDKMILLIFNNTIRERAIVKFWFISEMSASCREHFMIFSRKM